MFKAIKLKLLGRYTIPSDVVKADVELLEKRYPSSYAIPTQYKGEKIKCSQCAIHFVFSALDKKEYYEKRSGNLYAKIQMCPKCYLNKYSK